jgi:hypothetical protein
VTRDADYLKRAAAECVTTVNRCEFDVAVKEKLVRRLWSAKTRTSASLYAPLWLSNQFAPGQPPPLKGGAFIVGTADGALRVVGAEVWPGAAITVVDDQVSGVERSMTRVSIPVATSAPTPTTTESLLGGWPELCRYGCFIVVTWSARLCPWTNLMRSTLPTLIASNARALVVQSP